jgi:site-specific recombinase XerD
MPSLKFYIKPNDEYNRVRIRYTYNRDSRSDFFCGVNLSSYDNFDKDNELNPIKKKEADSEYKNNQLKHIKRTIEDVIQSLRLNKKTPTALLVKQKYKVSKINQFENTDVEARINTFFIIETIDEYISHLRSRVSIGDNMRLTTFQKNSRIMERWKDFFKSKKQISIQFEELRNRYTLFREFGEWAIKNHSFANSSVNKYNSTFRNFLRWAMKMDFHNIDLGRFDSPNLKEVSNRTVLALTTKQLQSIYNFTDFHYSLNGVYNSKCETFKKKEERYFFVEDVFNQRKYDKDDNVEIIPHFKKYTSMEVVKDFFCFLCSTSLAYVDAANLKVADFDFVKDCFELIRIKTSAPTTIPMNEMSRAIWMKYSKDKNGKRNDGNKVDTHYLFPRFGGDKFLSNANTNSMLKRIGLEVKADLSNMVNIEVRSGSGYKDGTEDEKKLYEVLHTHMGRKTFINFALSQKISPTDIKKISGHSDEKMFKYYVNSLRDEVKEEFQTMGAFMGKGEFIGPKGSKSKKESVEAKTEMLLQKRKNGILSESEFLVELSKLIPSKEKEKKL